MAIFKRGEIWWYEFQFQGQRIRQSSKSPIKAVCIQAERERRRELERGVNHLQEVVRPALFCGAARSYLLDREAHWSPKTRVGPLQLWVKPLSGGAKARRFAAPTRPCAIDLL